MSSYPTAKLTALAGDSVVHLVGISHTSAYSGCLVHDVIKEVKPDVVVLEVDEGRLRAQAQRAQQWRTFDRASMVQDTVRPYLYDGSLWGIISAFNDHRHAHRLAMEGSAMLEGSVYGAEVIRACEAAQDCRAAVVAADREQALSEARCKAAYQLQYNQQIAALPDDDWSLLTVAAHKAAGNLSRLVYNILAPVCKTNAQIYAEQLHPVFLLADAPQYCKVLEAVGCKDSTAVVQALKNFMSCGSCPGGQINTEDLRAVQSAIRLIEHHKHVVRHHALSGKGSAGAASSGAAPSCVAAAATVSARQPELDHARMTVDAATCCCASLDQQADLSHLMQSITAPGAQCRFDSLLQSVWRRISGLLGGPEAARGIQPDSDDPFYRWCWRGKGHLHSFVLAHHVHAQPAADDPAMTPYYRCKVFERDAILAHRISEVAREQCVRTVVAVVGANHLQGIMKNWQHAQKGELEGSVREFLQNPQNLQLDPDAWKVAATDQIALGMEGAAVGLVAYLPWRVLGRAAPSLAHCVPLAALSGLVFGSAVSAAGRVSGIAHLVHNLAAHQDVVSALETV